MSIMKVIFSDPQEIADFLNKVEKHDCDIKMSSGEIEINGNSFLGVINMGLGSEIELTVFDANCDRLNKLKRDIAQYLVA